MAIHNKLIRDKILQMLDSKGISHTEHIADETEYRTKLFEKILEEAKELVESEDPGELADLLEVIEAIKTLKNWTTEEIESIRMNKKQERGGFERRIILEES